MVDVIAMSAAAPAPATMSKAMLFVLAFIAVSALFAIFDKTLAEVPDLRAFGRCIGPLGSFLAGCISIGVAIRYRQPRFLLAALLASLLLALWVWRFYVEAHHH